jgi:hypothetical protein
MIYRPTHICYLRQMWGTASMNTTSYTSALLNS